MRSGVQLNRVCVFVWLAALGACTPSAADPSRPVDRQHPREPIPTPEPLDVPALATPPPPRYPGPCWTEYRGYNLTQRRTYDYDARGLVIQRRFSGGNQDRTDTFGYDREARLQSIDIVSRGPNAYVQHERFYYDAHGRRVRTDRWNRGSSPQWQEFQRYDAQGRLMSRHSKTVATGRVGFRRRFVYEAERLTREEVDNRGRRQYPLTVFFHYDRQGYADRKYREWDDRPSPSEEEWLSYDDLGRLHARSDTSKTTRLNRDAAGNVETIEESVANGTTTSTVVYDYGCWANQPIPADAPLLVPHVTLVDMADVPPITL